MAGRSAHVRQGSHEASTLHQTPERRRTSSQGDATPRPGFLKGANTSGHDHNNPPPDQHSRRLGFLGDKLSSQRNNPLQSQLLPPRSHSRAESAFTPNSREFAASPTSGMNASSSQLSKGYNSPAKPSSTRTYDSKLVSREMHRLGNLAHLPSLGPSISTAPSTVSLSAPQNVPSMSNSASGDNPWSSLHVHVLPLFNGEPLSIPIEDLNALVKRHIQAVVSLSPGRALATLEHDTAELISSGMVTLNAKLNGIDDKKLVGRVVEVWGFFWDQVLPYLEGALLPLQTDQLLSSLYRTPKAHKPNAPGSGGSLSALFASSGQIDVRTVALQAFRDCIILPISPRLHVRFLLTKEDFNSSLNPAYQQPRLQQMLLVLVSQRAQRPPTLAFSLNTPTPVPSAGEAAIQRLLRDIRNPLIPISSNRRHSAATGAPSFLAAGVPRDRRGRIATKYEHGGSGHSRGIIQITTEHIADEDDGDGGETPRMAGFAEKRGERGRELLESLKSPDPENVRGGWGLGVGSEVFPTTEEDDEEMNWDQAQAVVERMVGMTPSEHAPSILDSRRRPT